MKGSRMPTPGRGRAEAPTGVRAKLLRLLAVPCFIAAATAGCHTFQPIMGEPPSPGEQVRVRLTAVASDDLSRQVGRQVRSLEGRVLHATADSVRLDVGWGAIYAGTAFEGRRDTLTFREGQYVELDRKEFSRGRTALVVAGAVVAVAALMGSVSGGGSSPGEPSNGPTLSPAPLVP